METPIAEQVVAAFWAVTGRNRVLEPIATAHGGSKYKECTFDGTKILYEFDDGSVIEQTGCGKSYKLETRFV